VATAVLAVRSWASWASSSLVREQRAWALAPAAWPRWRSWRSRPCTCRARPTPPRRALLRAARGRPGRHRGALLALTPDYAYVLQGQRVEMHGSALPYLERSRVPGVERILARLRERGYGAVVIDPQYWPDRPEWHAALQSGYRLAGRCRLGYYYGDLVAFYVMVRSDANLTLGSEGGARCEAPAAVLQR